MVLAYGVCGLVGWYRLMVGGLGGWCQLMVGGLVDSYHLMVGGLVELSGWFLSGMLVVSDRQLAVVKSRRRTRIRSVSGRQRS